MYYVILFVSKILCSISEERARELGDFFGGLAFVFLRKSRAQALKNLRLVFPDKSLDELQAIVRANFCSIALMFIEFMRLSQAETDMTSDKFIIEGREYLDKIIAEGGIFVSVHSGNWELINSCAPKIMKYMVIVKRQKNAGFNRFLTQQRTNAGCKIIFDDDLRSIMKQMKNDFNLAVMFDHGFRRSTIEAKIFNKQVQVPKGGFSLAKKYNKDLYPVFFSRKDGKCCVSFSEPICVTKPEEFSVAAQKMNDFFEKCLREYPYDYLWSYKRFKCSSTKNILVLSDSKPGHFNQSISLARLISDNYPGSTFKTVELKDLSKLKRFYLDLLLLFKANKKSFGNLRLLEKLFPELAEDLFVYCDMIISTGSSLSSLNRLLSSILDAKSVVFMRPNFRPKLFDRIFLPEHDRRLNTNDVRFISGAFAYLSDSVLLDSAKELYKTFDIDKNQKKISLFVGGPLKGSSVELTVVETFFKNLVLFAKNNNYSIMITTSRRTPKEIEELVENCFADSVVKIIANKKNFSFAAKGLVAEGDIVISTADSISMITEAASYKDTYIADLFDVFDVSGKHMRFAECMESNNFSKILRKSEFVNLDKLVDAFTDKFNFCRVDNVGRVSESLKDLF